MSNLHAVLATTIPRKREEVGELVNEYGQQVIGEVTVQQAFGGLRGVPGLVCDTSLVDPEQGVFLRGIPIVDLADRLPEEIFYLLLTGHLPDAGGLEGLRADLRTRAEVPAPVMELLRVMPKDSHPLDMLVSALAAQQKDSHFTRRYEQGMPKAVYWEPVLEDALTLLARLPAIAAAIYSLRYGQEPLPVRDAALDWGTGFAHMLGRDDPDFAAMLRTYLVLHSDHEGGNVCAFTSRVASSSLANPYWAVAAGLCALAGPLYGRANQEALRFILDAIEQYGGPPDREQMRRYARQVLDSGRVIPGYGHAVLKGVDPRFLALHRFGQTRCADSAIFRTVDIGYQVIPSVLTDHGRARNPWPNVDAASGCMLYHYGLRELPFYTVLYGVSRAIGVLAQMVLSRAIEEPLTRPKSVTTEWIHRNMQATEVAMTAGD